MSDPAGSYVMEMKMNYLGRSAETLRLLEDAQTEEEKRKRNETNALMDEIVQRGVANRDTDRTDKSVLIICAIISAVILLFDVAVSCSINTSYQPGAMIAKGALDRNMETHE